MTILVTGATGTVGRRVVEQLLERGEHVRALTRDPARAELPAGVDVVRGDLTDPASLEPALDGVTGLHLITFGGGLFAPLETGEEILGLAREAGVRRVTVLHGGGGTPMESAVRASGFDWTVVMPVEFMANALEWAPGIRSEGVVREPFVDRLSAMVHESDIGAVAAVALTEDGHGGQEYLVTGPQVLTVRDKTAAVGAARGADVELVELTEEQARESWRGQGMPEDVIAFLIGVYRDTPPEGRTVIDTVEKVTGRPARTFAQWAEEHAEHFRAQS
ncbi:NAD(P)H-binding protein [Streptomyces sp. ID03-2B]|uniref:NAD(P)H-binding protein n=1 Tax=Streptomyces TaxID=1883 RepID=UPI000A3CBD3E|nr:MULTISPECIES: NAD(P)H-binding protein [Streptomyces]MDX2670111.1 NAD(P)H-binding protein [Streptomyces sp. NRRL_ISP-5395]MDX3591519.1 NAD(P)H-binding protein [Streptomyces sp. ID03-2B]QXQ98360.1 NAD(P)H-binding protein [Streptomyces sp. WY228]GHF90023.1 nucleotide-diphosphate-sugar epimerase [Streptomyces griseus]